jgi:ABC-2 type transport system permease protein
MKPLSSLFSKNDRVISPFRVIVQKEISDHVSSWRFIILISIIALTCFGSMYTALTNIKSVAASDDPDSAFLFLKLYTITDGTLPSFFIFIGFLGPLLGISLGFDAINSERNKGTLSRILSQPVHRDFLINAKFVASLTVISVLFFVLGFLMMGLGIIITGIIPAPEEFLRVIFFILLSILYVAFWLNLAILFSVKLRHSATSALACIAIWLFLTAFYNIIVGLIAKALEPSPLATSHQVFRYQEIIMTLIRILPGELYNDATTTLLMPSVRSLGPLTMEQIMGAIPGPLPLGQSLLLVWPQITGLIAATVFCFVISYVSFMRMEIRSR